MSTLTWACFGLTIILLGASLVFHRVAIWHSEEASYWYEVAELVWLKPSLKAQHDQILDWTREHEPSTWEKVRGWRPPAVRMDSTPEVSR